MENRLKEKEQEMKKEVEKKEKRLTDVEKRYYNTVNLQVVCNIILICYFF